MPGWEDCAARRGLPRRAGRRGGGESGMSALEVALLAPLVIGFVLVLVCFGVIVDARGSVEGAARDAARAGSMQRDDGSANAAAQSTAADELGRVCERLDVEQTSTGFTPGTLYTVRVSCAVPLSGIDWFALGTQTIVIDATAPLDTYRRSG
jgi:Flp pilus assembly protein TadG